MELAYTQQRTIGCDVCEKQVTAKYEPPAPWLSICIDVDSSSDFVDILNRLSRVGLARVSKGGGTGAPQMLDACSPKCFGELLNRVREVVDIPQQHGLRLTTMRVGFALRDGEARGRP